MSDRAKKSVAVVGGGVGGLATAWRLALLGCAVTVFERSAIPAQSEAASWAAAGMLCAHLEMQDAPPALAAFALASRAAWAEFAATLETASGCAIGYRTTGALHVSLCGTVSGHVSGDGVERIAADRARMLEPALSAAISAPALWAPGEGLVDPRALCFALAEACRRAAVTLRPHTAIEAMEPSGRTIGLRIAATTMSFDHVMFAAGAWSSALLAGAGVAAPRIRPIKGQTLSLAMPAGAPAPRRIVWTDDAYIVPLPTGRLVIGATQEDIGFESGLDHAGLDALKASAIAVMPHLASLPELDRAVGFRPATDDGLPAIGGVGAANLTLASGQFRNGILFAPLLAEVAAQHVLDGTLPAIATPFGPGRFRADAADKAHHRRALGSPTATAQ